VGTGEYAEEEDVIELLSKLVDKTLVVAELRVGYVGRYRLLEPVRQYALERLQESGEAEEVRRRHAEFFLALAGEASPRLTGAQQQEWANRLEADHDNLRGALSWALERESEPALRLAGALARFWEIRSHSLEGSRWIEAAIRQSDHADGSVRAKALSFMARHWHSNGTWGTRAMLPFALLCLGVQGLEQGEHERPIPFRNIGAAAS